MHEDLSSLRLTETPEKPPIDDRKRREIFERQATSTSTTENDAIDLGNLRSLSFSSGLPERRRALGWKLLLGYLPPRKREWKKTLEEKRREYRKFASDFVVVSVPEVGGGRRTEEEEEDDHPLSQAASSSWGAYFRDADLVAQICRDVARTHPGMHFFGDDSENGNGDGRRDQRRRRRRRGQNSNNFATRRGEMARALLVFAKLNPGLAYVQGMNEIFAPLYYHCALEEEENKAAEEEEEEEEAAEEEEEEEQPQHHQQQQQQQTLSTVPSPTTHPPSSAEADAFWCLVSLMADFRDNFCSALDRSDAGVAGSLARVERAVRAADAELASHVLDVNGVSPHFFAFRWVSLLLTQEFELPDVARLWDYLFAVSGSGSGGGENDDEDDDVSFSPSPSNPPSTTLTRPEALARLCAAMVVRAREPLLRGDFASNLKLLQRFPPELADVRTLLEVADSLPPGVGRDEVKRSE